MASIVVCPFCFHRIDASRLWYQCLGRGYAECTKEVDKAREKLTKSTLETYPSFPPPEGASGPASAQSAAAKRTCAPARSATPRCRPTSRSQRVR